jgi:hypothetical protein
MPRRVMLAVLLSLMVIAALATHRAQSAENPPNVRSGTDAADTISGTPADDAIYGRGGNDRINGEGGNDDLDGGPGADDLRGGAGNDAASYGSDDAAVTVTLDDRPNDGLRGEGDNVHTDVEDVYGGAGNDRLVGSATGDTLDGGAGDDTLIGGKGVDGLYGGYGDDVINARDGEVDTVDCGPGRDRAQLDAGDVETGCERTNIVRIPIFRSAAIPVGERASRACRGRVQMSLMRGRKQLAHATVALRRNCRYSFVFRIVKSRIGKAKTLTLVLRLTGNRAVSSAPVRVQVDVPRSG